MIVPRVIPDILFTYGFVKFIINISSILNKCKHSGFEPFSMHFYCGWPTLERVSNLVKSGKLYRKSGIFYWTQYFCLEMSGKNIVNLNKIVFLMIEGGWNGRVTKKYFFSVLVTLIHILKVSKSNYFIGTFALSGHKCCQRWTGLEPKSPSGSEWQNKMAVNRIKV